MSPADMMPFRVALARLDKVGLPFSRDRWETWIACGLMDTTQRIPGTNDYGLSPEQWTRFKTLVVVDAFIYGRSSPGAIAYYAVLWLGMDVPVDLIADYLEKSVRGHYRYLGRYLIQRSHGKHDPRMMSDADLRAVARKETDRLFAFASIPHPVKRAVGRQLAEELMYFFLSSIYPVFRNRESNIRNIAENIFNNPVGTIVAAMLRKFAQRHGKWFVDPLYGENHLIANIQRERTAHPKLILRAVPDSGIFFEASSRGFGNVPSAERPKPFEGRAHEDRRGFNTFIPTISAIFLAFNVDDPNDRFLQFLRRDEGKALEDRVRRWDRVSEHRIAKLIKKG